MKTQKSFKNRPVLDEESNAGCFYSASGMEKAAAGLLDMHLSISNNKNNTERRYR